MPGPSTDPPTADATTSRRKKARAFARAFFLATPRKLVVVVRFVVSLCFHSIDRRRVITLLCCAHRQAAGRFGLHGRQRKLLFELLAFAFRADRCFAAPNERFELMMTAKT